LIEQNATKALAVSQRGYVMQKGQMVIAGTKDELLASNVVQSSYLVS